MVRKLLWGYLGVAILTLAFQLWVRSGACGNDCTISFAKGFIWAVIWPASWVVYLAGPF
jgi:hypothetical protein